jgi:NADP-dependent 3-hydroxy acid dehydrogenase YdfG
MKHAVVTGASSGIGRATAIKLAKDGWRVTGIARSFSDDDKEFMQPISLDLADLDGLKERLKQLDIDRPDALILNAGRGLFGGLEQLSDAQICQTVNLNLVSPMLLVKHFLAQMKRAGGADILLVGSEAALSGAKQGAVYCASKFGLRGLAQSLRADCSDANVRVMLVNPGPCETEFFRDLHFEPKAQTDTVLLADDVAYVIHSALSSPRHVVHEEINVQPMKRAFQSKAKSNLE